MAVIPVQVVSIAGTAPNFVAASAGGDTVAAGDRTQLQVKNASGSPITVTITTPGTVAGLAIADVVVSVPATTGIQYIGPLTAALFSDPAQVTYSASTSVTVCAVAC
jgi:hypothetical protein